MDQERFNTRLAIAPYLQAEEVSVCVLLPFLLNSYCKYMDQQLKKEAEAMKDIPGWEVGKSVYNSRKWVPRPKQA